MQRKWHHELWAPDLCFPIMLIPHSFGIVGHVPRDSFQVFFGAYGRVFSPIFANLLWSAFLTYPMSSGHRCSSWR